MEWKKELRGLDSDAEISDDSTSQEDSGVSEQEDDQGEASPDNHLQRALTIKESESQAAYAALTKELKLNHTLRWAHKSSRPDMKKVVNS